MYIIFIFASVCSLLSLVNHSLHRPSISVRTSSLLFCHLALKSSSFIGSSILLCTPFAKNLTQSVFSIKVGDQVSHPHETDKIVVLCIYIFTFLEQKTGKHHSEPNRRDFIQSSLNFINAIVICVVPEIF